jgi:phage-related protein
MALSTFTPPVAPSPGTGIKRKLRLLQAEFGDGYTQPTPDGINHMRKTLTLKWDSLTEAQMKAIDDFLSDHAGTQPFYYRPAGHAAPLKWTCAEWEASVDGVWRITATFVENFGSAT